jgi:small subunit ribosomal protein S17
MKVSVGLKVMKGKVLSVKNLKTAVVENVRFVEHPVYKKRIKRIKKYQVHDEIGVKVGQTVSFVPSKPYSKLKKWRILA